MFWQARRGLISRNPVDPAGTAPFSPSSLPLVMWYKMDTLTGTTGDYISTLSDFSGNGHDLTQTSTNRAQLQAADQNGLNTILFSPGANTNYPITAAWLSGLTAASMYIVYNPFVGSGNGHCLGDFGSSPSSSNWPFTDSKFYTDFGSTVRKTTGTQTGSVGNHYTILSLYSAASDWALYVDGGTGGSSGGTSALFSTGTNTVGWNAAPLLGSAAGLAAIFSGWIGELLITSAKESAGNRQKVEGYLAWKWGLTGQLDSTHPYKSSAP